ncbi:MAG: 2-C-methyl-D-erythritol 4-phosphate cytidylyltransferase [Bacteroidales bacterium]|nr:2-C-methyl-D-erythritol 4-phosphate cytidylyltransferase [Bacteroidales bacterium]
MKKIAAILAGGVGKRLNSELPKQFMLLAGKPMIVYSLEAFQHHSAIDEIALVVPSDYVNKCEIYKKDFSKLTHIIAGGEERYLSTLAVLNTYQNNTEDLIILHDAARPMVTVKMIDEIINALKDHKAATVAIKTTDTIVQSLNHATISGTFDRSTLYNVQTPQAFKISVLKQAYQLALKDPCFIATDDTAVVFNYLPDEKIAIVAGSPYHIKLTYQEDIQLMEEYMRKKNKRL